MSESSPRPPLAGQRIWLTRPMHQAGDWAVGLRRAGAQVDIEPLMRILPPADEEAARNQLVIAEHAAIVIATSPNAVRAVQRLSPGFTPSGELFAVGDATAAPLQQMTGRTVNVPDTADTSEGLLDMPGLKDIAGTTVVLLSGHGGRRKLVGELTQRGAHVTKLALYRRQMADIDHHRLVELITRNNAAVVTSGEAVVHLCTLLRSCDPASVRQGLGQLQLVVPSPRVVQLTPEDLFRQRPRAVARMTVDAVVDVLAGAGTSV